MDTGCVDNDGASTESVQFQLHVGAGAVHDRDLVFQQVQLGKLR